MHIVFNKLEKQKKGCCYFVDFVVDDNLIPDNPKFIDEFMIDHNAGFLA